MAVDGSSVDSVAKVLTPFPYTLASSDNPGALISPILLNGDNYNEWSIEMYNALRPKRKTGFIEGSLKKPPITNPDFENLQTVNYMIVGWIRASIEPKVKSTVTFIDEAYHLWLELKQRFSVGNKVRVHQIKAQLASCRQDGQFVVLYYRRLCTLWEELRVYQHLGACTCEAGVDFSKEREEEKLHQFLMGLDYSRFGSLCASIIGMDPLPTIAEAYSRVIREKQRMGASRL